VVGTLFETGGSTTAGGGTWRVSALRLELTHEAFTRLPEAFLGDLSRCWARPGGNPGTAWNTTSFAGAILTFDELDSASDQRATAIEFFRSRRDLLA
jgi:hypothetical protein